MPAEGCGVDPGGERRILFEDAAMSRCCEFPSVLGWVRDGPVGQPAIHSSISDMMGFGHVPTGSIRNDGHTGIGGPRR